MSGGGDMINCTRIDHNTVQCDGKDYHLEELLGATDVQFWVYLIMYLVLVLFAGLMSGLTMGLLSLDILSLEVLKRGGKTNEQRYSKRILTLVKRHHLLLVTLLLANAVAVETMPIFLSKITSEVVAIIVSVTAVLLFGEIIPQAICTRFGLAIGYYFSPLVWLLLALFFPISFPIAILLDRILGKDHNTFFRRAELRELVKLHGSRTHDNEEPLSYDEVLIVKSALEMRDKVVDDIMTPLESVFMLSHDATIDRQSMKEILHRGHSRVPVYSGTKDNIVGMLLVKRLIQLDPDECTPIASLEGASTPPPSCVTSMPLFDLLNQFQTGRSHLYLVYKEDDGISEPQLVGIITLEDVIEELIGEEIVDETDLYVDVHKRIAVARARLQYHKQSVSAPPMGAAGHRPPHLRHHRWQRSMSQDSSFSDMRRKPTSPQTGSAPTTGGHPLLIEGGRALSVVAEIEERSPQATPTDNEEVGLIQREESTHSEWEDGDTLPLI